MVMGQSVETADVVVIGGGPGGYVAAIRAAQLGKKVVLVDKAPKLGGVCLTKGCIPSKALIHVSEFLYHLDHSDNMGVTVDHIHFDPKKMQEWKEGIITKLSDGVGFLCKKHGVEVIRAHAYMQNSRTVGLEPLNPEEHLEYGAIECKKIIIATGTRPIFPKGLERDGKVIIGSTEALSLTEIPKSIVIVGGGYIGIELGIVYAKFGSQVTIVQKGDRIIPAVDPELSKVLAIHCEEMNINIRYNTQVTEAKVNGNQANVTLDTQGKKETITSDIVFVAVGRRPDTTELTLENTKVKLDERGFIKTNEQRQTDDVHIYAIGDIAGGALLAHKASMEGRVAAEAACGMPTAFDAQVVPAVIYSDPEIAMVGMTEEQAKQEGYEPKVGRFPFKSSGRALTMNETRGFVKVVADKETHLILGVHIVGPNASDLISEASLAIEMGARIEDVSLTIHPHPTLSESLNEAMQSILGEPGKMFKKS